MNRQHGNSDKAIRRCHRPFAIGVIAIALFVSLGHGGYVGEEVSSGPVALEFPNPPNIQEMMEESMEKTPPEEIVIIAKSTATPTYEDPSFTYAREIPLDRDVQYYIWKECKKQNVRYTMVLALIKRESQFRTDAVHLNKNGTYDQGLMQLNDTTRSFMAKIGVTDYLDPYQNAMGGISLLRYHLNNNGGNEQAALMAYQYGQAGSEQRYSAGIYTSDAIEVLYKYESEIARLYSA